MCTRAHKIYLPSISFSLPPHIPILPTSPPSPPSPHPHPPHLLASPPSPHPHSRRAAVHPAVRGDSSRRSRVPPDSPQLWDASRHERQVQQDSTHDCLLARSPRSGQVLSGQRVSIDNSMKLFTLRTCICMYVYTHNASIYAYCPFKMFSHFLPTSELT